MEMAEIRHRPGLWTWFLRKRLCWDNLSQTLGIYISGQKICIAFDPIIPLLEIQQEEIVADVCKAMCTRMLNSVLFIIEKNWK